MPSLFCTPEDLQWLQEAHGIPTDGAVCAVVYGDKDWPDKVEIHVKDDSGMPPLVYLPDGKGNLCLAPTPELDPLGDFLTPNSDVTEDGIRTVTWTINIPGDVYPDMEQLARLAIDHAREGAADYVMPCEWSSERIAGHLGDHEVTFCVTRKSRA